MPKRHTILVVDDEPDVVKSVQDLLRLDYRVLGTTKAREAIEIMAREEVHIVMSDQRMPEMTGVEFLHHIRGDHPEAIRLLFTGYADIRAVIDAINQGNVYRYITKPWDPDELQTVIREAVDRFDLIIERNRLMAELKGKNQDLESANAMLRQADELKSAFIQVASHELRTPLTILRGVVSLASMSGGAQPPMKEWLDRIRKAAERLGHLVDQLVTMLSLNQVGKPLDRRPTDLAPLLASAADDIRPFIELRRQVLQTTLAPDLGAGAVDPAQIRDSVNHLLLNAIKFTPDGGTITLDARRDGGAVKILVADTGVGIEPTNRQKLFQPFFTGFDVSKHSSGQYEFNRQGLGLGLSVVRKFVEMHGGSVDVASEPGKGTTFTVTLPVAPPAGATEAEGAAAPGAPLATPADS